MDRNTAHEALRASRATAGAHARAPRPVRRALPVATVIRWTMAAIAIVVIAKEFV